MILTKENATWYNNKQLIVDGVNYSFKLNSEENKLFVDASINEVREQNLSMVCNIGEKIDEPWMIDKKEDENKEGLEKFTLIDSKLVFNEKRLVSVVKSYVGLGYKVNVAMRSRKSGDGNNKIKGTDCYLVYIVSIYK